jgi:hypothetical protein
MIQPESNPLFERTLIPKRLLGVIALTAMLVSGALGADSSSPPHATAYLTLNESHDLCNALLKQAKHVLNQVKDLRRDKGAGLDLPLWERLDPKKYLGLLSQTLPRIGSATAQLESKIQKEVMPNAPWDDIQREFWRRYGEHLIETLAGGNGSLEATSLDFDNAGHLERVYRVSILDPVDPNKPDGAWTAIPCISHVCLPRPRYALFLSPEDQRRLRVVGGPIMENSDLFEFRGQTYVVNPGASVVNFFWLTSTDEVYRQPTCTIFRKAVLQ